MQSGYTHYSLLMKVAKMTEKEQPRFSCSTLSDYEGNKNKAVPRESFVQRVLDLCERAKSFGYKLRDQASCQIQASAFVSVLVRRTIEV